VLNANAKTIIKILIVVLSRYFYFLIKRTKYSTLIICFNFAIHMPENTALQHSFQFTVHNHPVISYDTKQVIGRCCHMVITPTSRGSSVGIALGYGLDDWGSRVRFPAGLGIFLFTTASTTALRPTQPPIQWV
jgi:hypothetical protein